MIKETEWEKDAKILLIPTIAVLSRILECYQNGTDKNEIEKLEKQYKKSFKFPLEQKFFLY